MRWRKREPRAGDTRVVQHFAIFPVTIEKDGVRETRWLETVRVGQTLTSYFHGLVWEDTKFLEVK